MNLHEHNKRMLSLYTRDNGKQLRVAQLDDNGKILRVFKNRYQAAKYLVENKFSNYMHPKGLGYTRACIAGSLTSLMCRQGKAYGYLWKLLSPYDNSQKVTEEFVHERTGGRVYTKRNIWLVIGPHSKKYYFHNSTEVKDKFKITENEFRKLRSGEVIKGLTVLKNNPFPVVAEFDSIAHACRALRASKETIRKAMKTSTPINGYFISISPEKMAANMNKTKHLGG